MKEQEPLHEEVEEPYNIVDSIVNKSEINRFFGDKLCIGFMYECYDYEAEKMSALKTLKDKYLSSKVIVDNFKKEVLAWIRLEKHPNIVYANFVNRLDNRLVVISEVIVPDEKEKNTLAQYLEEPIPIKQALTWSIQFCYGMEHAYSKGVTTHGDIKPENIMIARGRILKIIGFGFAGLWKGANISDLGSAVNNIIAGDPAYMAPEQFNGIADVRSDIYSFGIVMYQMINNGRLPFYPRAGDDWEKAHKHYAILPQQAEKGEDSGLFMLIDRCLRKKPDERYTKFEKLREALEALYIEATGETPPLPPDEIHLMAWELYNKGASLHNLGLIDEAIKVYREVIKINSKADYETAYKLGYDPTKGDRALVPEAVLAAYFKLGFALYDKGDFDDAIRVFKELIRINPENALANYNLGNALKNKGQFDEAKIAFNNFMIFASTEHAEYVKKAEEFINLHKEEM